MTARLLIGDARQRIKEIPDGSIDLVCTSPPFLALRKYGDNSEAEMGSEANPAAFIDALLELSAEFRRVLTPHGSIAIELGDTYSGSGGAGGDYNDGGLRDGQERFNGSAARARAHAEKERTRNPGPDWPLAKSLAGIPEAFMLSLAYGYNVLDPSGLASGSARMSEERAGGLPLTAPPQSPAGRWRVRNVIVWARPNPPVGALGDKVRPATSYITVACTSDKRWFDLDAVRTPHARDYSKEDPSKQGDREFNRNGTVTNHERSLIANEAGAPPLDWWEDNDPTGHFTMVLPTQPYPFAHYATWPATLAKRLIEMMCPVGGTVLDPFCGSGTTISVAHGCGRNAIGIELYESNCDLIRDRLGFFLDVVA